MEITPSKGAIIAGVFGALTSNNCLTLSIPVVCSPHFATPPSWKVSSVNCVDGSPID
jgi:hypothetical protein